MKALLQILLITSSYILLTACASMNQSECLSADWHTVGFGDGVAGLSQSKISHYRKDCAGFGVQPDLERYRQGHLAGSKLFCTWQNGFKRGKQGDSYNNNCPQSLAPEFLAAYADGKQLFQAYSHLVQIQDKFEYTRKQLKKNKTAIDNKQQELIADGLLREQRVTILEQIEKLREKQDELEGDYHWLLDQLEQAQFDHQQLEQQLSAHYL